MSDVIKKFDNVLSPATKETEKICGEVYGYLKECEVPFDVPIKHTLHGGVYTRTAFIPRGTMGLGALLKVPTTVIVSGNCYISNGKAVVQSVGYAVLEGNPNRRSIFYAVDNTYISMIAKVKAKTVEEAEKEVTDEWEYLTTHKENK